MGNISATKKRIHFLDEIRGLAVFCMIFYHAFFILGEFFNAEWATELFIFFMPVQPFFAGIFIFICGMSCTLSKSNLKRGAVLLGIALGMTLVTAVIMPKLGFSECEIYFGILHFLAVCVIAFALLSKKLFKLSPFAGAIICAVLYAFTSGIESGHLNYGELISIDLPQSLYASDFLMPLGIYSLSFYSADYFPLFPDIFIFFAGALCGIYFAKSGYPAWCYEKKLAFFGFLGKKALIIYIAHMPLIFGIAYGIDFIINSV